MTGTVGIDDVLVRVWTRRTSGGAPEWMRGLGASDTRRRLGPAVASRRIGLAAPTGAPGGRSRSTVRLDREEAQLLQAWLAGPGWDVVRDLCRVARELKDGTVDSLRAAGIAVVPRDVGSWALGVVGAHYRRHGDCPTLGHLEDAAREHVVGRDGEGPLRALQLARPAFDAVADPEWDRVWPPGRAPAGHRPARSGLGRDARPPMYGRIGNWRAGTDRPVHLRYRRYFDASSRVAAHGLPPESHVTRRYLGAEPAAIVLDEVRRSAAPLGLADPGHVAGVVAVADGLRPDPGRPRAVDGADLLDAWAEQPGPLPPDPDPELARAVTAFAVEWAANDTLAGVLELDAATLAGAVARRVRHRLHGREVEWDTPLGRAEFGRELRGAFGRHLLDYDGPPDGPSDGPAPGDPPGDDTPPDGPPPAALDLDDSERRTFDVLRDDSRTGRLLTLIRNGDDGWRRLYGDIVAGIDGLLSADEFYDFTYDLAEAS